QFGFQLIQKACDDGAPWGCIEAGLRLEAGRGVAKDPSAARKRFERACELEDPVDPTASIACARATEREGATRLAAGDASAAEAKFKAACDAGAGHGCLQLASLRVSELQALNDKVAGTKPCDDGCRRAKAVEASTSYFAACDAAVPALEACSLGVEWSAARGLTEASYRYEKLRRACRLGHEPTCAYIDKSKIAR
ncbi:MAG: sel1 repeat family protein, partial [Myxococcales bacterium]|nr:sel1 repeat family protein [Myxococcales bacterium]